MWLVRSYEVFIGAVVIRPKDTFFYSLMIDEALFLTLFCFIIGLCSAQHTHTEKDDSILVCITAREYLRSKASSEKTVTTPVLRQQCLFTSMMSVHNPHIWRMTNCLSMSHQYAWIILSLELLFWYLMIAPPKTTQQSAKFSRQSM